MKKILTLNAYQCPVIYKKKIVYQLFEKGLSAFIKDVKKQYTILESMYFFTA